MLLLVILRNNSLTLFYLPVVLVVDAIGNNMYNFSDSVECVHDSCLRKAVMPREYLSIVIVVHSADCKYVLT